MNSNSSNQDDAMMEDESTGEDQMMEDETKMEGDESTMEDSSEPQSYNDGSYTATGTYSYHSGTESIEVTLTLESGVITEAQVVSQAVAPTSKTMQADFIANYESEVIGKNIDEVNVGKVSGSSLTGIGFNAAVEDIKTQAVAAS